MIKDYARWYSFLFGIAVLVLSETSASAQWIVGTKENITYLSNDSVRKTQQIAKQVILFQNGIEQVIQQPGRSEKWPLRIMICKDGESFSSIAPVERKFSAEVAGYFTQGLAYDLILIKSNTNSKELKSIIYHELVHRLMKSSSSFPLWLSEGYAEVYSGFKIKKDKLHLGVVDIDHCRWINHKGLTPLSRLFHIGHQSPEYNEQNFSGSFYATSWIFVHFCLFSDHADLKNAFEAFVEASRGKIVDERMFSRHFRMSYKDMEKRLRKYARKFRHPFEIITIDPLRKSSPINFTPLDSVQEAIYRAGALTLAHRYEEALKILKRDEHLLSQSDENRHTQQNRYLNLLNERVQLEYYRENYEVAQTFAERAYDAGSRNPGVLIVYAEKLLETFPGLTLYYHDRISNRIVNRAMSCINQLIELDRQRPEVWRLYTFAWLRAHSVPSEKHLHKILNSCRIFPDDAMLHFMVSDLMMQLNRPQDAKYILSQLAAHTSQVSVKKEAEQKLNRIHL